MPDPYLLERLLEEHGVDGITRREILRRFGAGAGVLAAGGWLAACGGNKKKKRGGKLVVGAEADAYETKPAEANVGQYPQNANIFEGLVRMGPDYQVIPVLATAWTFRTPNTWRFSLRRGVRFHDGQPFDARAVKYTFDHIAESGGGTPGFGKRSTKIVDPYTVEVTPTFPNRRLVEQLVHPENSIIAPGSNPGRKPIGTGTFRFASYQRQQQIVVRRFAGYWGPKANLDQITFRFFPEQNARRLALEAGDIDIALAVPRDAVSGLKGRGFTVATAPPGAYEAFYQNIDGKKGNPALRELPVRRAIGYAIDRKALISGVLDGLAVQEQTMVPARLLGSANAAKIHGFGHDPALAERLLEGAGWKRGSDGVRAKHGRRLTLQLIDGFDSAKVHGAIPDFLQDQLKRVGVEVKIVKEPDSASYQHRLDSGQGDLWLELGHQNDADPAFLPALLFWSRGIFGHTSYQSLFAPGGRFDSIIVRSLATADPARLKSLVADAMHVLIDQDAVVVPLAGIYNVDAMSGKVHGYQPQPSALQVRYDGVSLSD